MQKIKLKLCNNSYPIFIGQNLIAEKRVFQEIIRTNTIAIVSNPVVWPLYGALLTKTLTDLGAKITPILVEDGERYKTLDSVMTIYDRLIDSRAERQTAMIALGGGVIGDMAGFTASTYLRGVPFIQVPTTLLAQVDAAIGGKTGVNHPRGKNLIGTFYQPQAVIIDLNTLLSLPQREYLAGLAEVVKYGAIADASFFSYLETHADELLRRDIAALEHAVGVSAAIKASVVQQDEKEKNLRAILNFGHTMGHVLETLGHYKTLLHGEAVSIGMVFAAELSKQLRKLPASDCQRIRQLLQRFSLPCELPDINIDDCLTTMHVDKKIQNGVVRFVLLNGIGNAYLAPVDEALIEKTLYDYRALGRS